MASRLSGSLSHQPAPHSESPTQHRCLAYRGLARSRESSRTLAIGPKVPRWGWMLPLSLWRGDGLCRQTWEGALDDLVSRHCRYPGELAPMSGPGQTRPGPASGKSGHVRYAQKAEAAVASNGPVSLGCGCGLIGTQPNADGCELMKAR